MFMINIRGIFSRYLKLTNSIEPDQNVDEEK